MAYPVGNRHSGKAHINQQGNVALFWTKAEYQRFAEAMMDKPLSYYAFEMLCRTSLV